MSDWNASLRSPFSACRRAGSRKKFSKARTQDVGALDELTQKGHYVGIGELDNHGNARSFFGLKRSIFPTNSLSGRSARMYFWKNL